MHVNVDKKTRETIRQECQADVDLSALIIFIN
jgi:hypothetical protein